MRGKAWMVSGLPATALPRLPETSCPRCHSGIFGSTIVLGPIKWQRQCRVLRCRLPDGTCPRAARLPEEPRKDGGAQHQGGAGVLQPLGTREQRWVGGQNVGLGVWESQAGFLGSSECAANPRDSLTVVVPMRGLLGWELGMQCLQHECFQCLSRGTGQRKEGVCRSCCVPEQSRGAVRTPTSACWLEQR